MEILVKGKKATKPIFGCWCCGCIFTANADEFNYDSNDETNYCYCPECGAKCRGKEESCYICKNKQPNFSSCDYKEYDTEHCEHFNVDKSALWRELGIYDKD